MQDKQSSTDFIFVFERFMPKVTASVLNGFCEMGLNEIHNHRVFLANECQNLQDSVRRSTNGVLQVNYHSFGF